MPTPTFQPLQGDISMPQIQDYIVKLIRDLNYMLENLDVQNIRAKGITADRLDVTQLSAIAADLGTITAGIIYGAYIATANGTYPRIEFSSAGNLLQAFYDAATYIFINPGVGGVIDPLIEFIDASTTSAIGNVHLFGHSFQIQSNQNVNVSSSAHNVNLVAPSGNVSAQSSAGSIADLVASINSLNSSISSLNGSVSSLSTNKADHGSTSSATVSDGHNHGIPNGTVLSTPTGTVTFVSYGGSAGHSHTI